MDRTDETALIASIRRRGTAIIALFAVASAVIVSALVYRIVVGGFADEVSQAVSAFVIRAYQISGEPTVNDAASLERLGQLAGDQIKTGNFSMIQLITPDGLIVYSTDARDTGTTVALDARMLSALEGEVSSVHLVTQGQTADVISRCIEAPLRLSQDGPIVGVLEIHRPYGKVWRGAIRSAATVAVVVLAGGLVAIGLLHFVTRRAEKAVRDTEDWAESLNERLRAVTEDRAAGHLGTIEALSTAVNVKDSYTALHSLNVSAYARAVADHAGWVEDVDLLERAGLVHDIGKIGIAESILRKPGKLTAEERTIIQEHAVAGAEILVHMPFLSDVVPTVRHHHERWDGGGYPDGLKGEDIPRTARLMAVVDAYDAMTTDRPYRRPLADHDALRELIAGRGTQFDPDCVDLFLAAHAAGRVAAAGSEQATGGKPATAGV